MRMLNQGGPTTPSSATAPPWVPTTPRPLGLAPLLASAQGYVDHAAFWMDALGLQGASSHIPETSK